MAGRRVTVRLSTEQRAEAKWLRENGYMVYVDNAGNIQAAPRAKGGKKRNRASGKARKYYVVDQVQGGLWYQVGHFHYKADAQKFQSALSGKTRIKKTYPASHNAVPEYR